MNVTRLSAGADHRTRSKLHPAPRQGVEAIHMESVGTCGGDLRQSFACDRSAEELGQPLEKVHGALHGEESRERARSRIEL